jgi:hypothetical protein
VREVNSRIRSITEWSLADLHNQRLEGATVMSIRSIGMVAVFGILSFTYGGRAAQAQMPPSVFAGRYETQVDKNDSCAVSGFISWGSGTPVTSVNISVFKRNSNNTFTKVDGSLKTVNVTASSGGLSGTFSHAYEDLDLAPGFYKVSVIWYDDNNVMVYEGWSNEFEIP